MYTGPQIYTMVFTTSTYIPGTLIIMMIMMMIMLMLMMIIINLIIIRINLIIIIIKLIIFNYLKESPSENPNRNVKPIIKMRFKWRVLLIKQ